MKKYISNDNDLIIENVQIFPDPVKDHFMLKTEIQHYNLDIRDLNGIRIMNLKDLSGSTVIDTHKMKPGIYLLKLSNSKSSHTQLLIKE